jgi:hypothetical protein
METEDVSQSRDGGIEILSLVPLILSLAAASQLGKAQRGRLGRNLADESCQNPSSFCKIALLAGGNSCISFPSP